MAVVKKLTRLGGSKAVVLPQAFLQQMNLTESDEVELTMTEAGVLVRAHRHATDSEFQASAQRIAKKRRRALERLGR